jgi:hypothetical protein
MLQAAAEKAKQTVAEHEYRLPDDVLRDIDEVYQAAETDLMNA